MSKLKVGDNAPKIQAKNQEGKSISLDDFKGKKIILFFYPKDNTPGCTAEACNLRDNYDDLISKGFEVIGVSADSEKSHQNFKSKHNLPYTLISDVNKEVIKEYGAWGEKKMYGKTYEGILRSTFIIDKEGKIEEIIEKVKTKDHTQQIFDELSI